MAKYNLRERIKTVLWMSVLLLQYIIAIFIPKFHEQLNKQLIKSIKEGGFVHSSETESISHHSTTVRKDTQKPKNTK